MPVDPEVMAQARKMIGHAGPARTELVTDRDIRRFAIAIGNKDPLHRDREYARKMGYRDIVAPAMYHMAYTFGDNDLDNLDESGVAGSFTVKYDISTPGYSGSVAAGHDIDFLAPIVAGDVITVQERVVDVYEKEGSRGPMIFLVTEYVITNQLGEIVLRDRSGQIRIR